MIEIELRINQYNIKRYFIKGTTILHRLDGPAVEHVNGAKFWYQNDKHHRLDGPAIEWSNGYKEWYLDGQRINCQTQEQFERIIKLKSFI